MRELRTITHALSAGFNVFVPKPVEPNELIAAMANLAELGLDQFSNHGAR